MGQEPWGRYVRSVLYRYAEEKKAEEGDMDALRSLSGAAQIVFTYKKDGVYAEATDLGKLLIRAMGED